MEKVEEIFCMKGGDGEASYARNSSNQREVMRRARHIVAECLSEVYRNFSPKCLVVADLGCASGPNALHIVSEMMDVIGKACHEMKHSMPAVQVFLNDLPSNDFSEIFKSLPDFYLKFEKQNKECFVAVSPGSFYGRLFPRNSLHFVHSSNALHWLSQVPQGLITETGEALNKGNILIAESSSPLVHKLYHDQFQKDFHLFLKSRSEELMPGGGLVLTLLGSVRSDQPFSRQEVAGLALCEMANEGLIEKTKLDMFNMPFYQPTASEIRRVVDNEGSFIISRLESLDTPWDPRKRAKDQREAAIGQVVDENASGKFVVKSVRAVIEPLLAAAFGEAVMDDLFSRLEKKFSDLMNAKECKNHHITISLKKT
uniref:Uncharacterized protein n=1 Tax=Kalanchoe fedtschenkoi TaxID=63787 RepID=A0A7N0TC56_KALFE